MTQEIDNSTENTLNDVDKVFAISGLALSGLSLLFYPVEEVADSTETDLGFVGNITKTVSMLGLIGTCWSMGLLYHREIKINPVIKWVLIPILILHVLVLTLVLSMIALKTNSVSHVGKLALKYVKPAVCSIGGVGIIIAMAVMSKEVLNMKFIGKTIHYLPAALGYAPINKHPFYVLVVFVRTGGLITSLAGGIVNVATENDDNTDEQLKLEG